MRAHAAQEKSLVVQKDSTSTLDAVRTAMATIKQLKALVLATANGDSDSEFPALADPSPEDSQSTVQHCIPTMASESPLPLVAVTVAAHSGSLIATASGSEAYHRVSDCAQACSTAASTGSDDSESDRDPAEDARIIAMLTALGGRLTRLEQHVQNVRAVSLAAVAKTEGWTES
jgi:hypothetical protein